MKKKTLDNIPLDIIRQWLDNKNWAVRKAAMQACQTNKTSIPIIRTFEPPTLVYKRCVADVIVVAEIPKDAQVRGKPGQKCHTNKAIIKEVIGEIWGEKVGISIHDRTTAYFVGDEIFVDDFDISDEECSTGFHFFCSLQEAQDYK